MLESLFFFVIISSFSFRLMKGTLCLDVCFNIDKQRALCIKSISLSSWEAWSILSLFNLD